MSQRFTPVRIQALECSTFHERKQGRKESVDTYAQELQRLFQRAYPNAVHGNPDAHEMGQAVLSSQFVSGLTPQIKRKIAYLEGATFSELWQKARFEEAHLRDLESATYTNHAPRKYHTTDDRRQGENPYPKNPPQNRGLPRQPRPGEDNQTISADSQDMWLEIADKAQGIQKQVAGKPPLGQQQYHLTVRQFSKLERVQMFQAKLQGGCMECVMAVRVEILLNRAHSNLLG